MGIESPLPVAEALVEPVADAASQASSQEPKEHPAVDREAIAAIESWLMSQARFLPDLGTVLEALSNRLVEAGIPLCRSTTIIQTLHPRYVAVSRIWTCGEAMREERPVYNPDSVTMYERSPLRYIRENDCWLNVRLDQGHDLDVPMLDRLAADGLVHYVLAPIHFSDGAINGVSWSTDNALGFTDEHVAIFDRLLKPLSLVVEIKGLRRIMPEILAAYVGSDPARRILDGAIHRGDVQSTDAAMLVCDLRGYTSMSNNADPDRVVEWLNGYFDTVVPAIEDEDGEILKFMGDGVFAAFTVSEDPKSCNACQRALRAAHKVLNNLGCVECMLDDYQPVISLHVGNVAYGNIGAGDRLDFTVIGGDVNLVSRLEGVCKDLGRRLVMSERFASYISEPVEDLGRFALKGFDDKVPVFGLKSVERGN